VGKYLCLVATKPTPRPGLRDAIFRSGKRQQDIAAKAGIHHTRLSRIVRGWIAPRPDEQKALAKALKAPVDDLFAEAS